MPNPVAIKNNSVNQLMRFTKLFMQTLKVEVMQSVYDTLNASENAVCGGSKICRLYDLHVAGASPFLKPFF